jgi:hypothetical protein
MCHPASQREPIVGRTRSTAEGAEEDRDWFRERMLEGEDIGPAWCEHRYVHPWTEVSGTRHTEPRFDRPADATPGRK